MLASLSVLLILGEGSAKKHAHFCLLSLSFALNIHRVHIQVYVNVLLHPCFKKTLFK